MRNNKTFVGDGIVSANGQWNFSDSAKNFDQHVKKSVPLYELGHDYISQLASFFLRDKGTVYEIGCSTGALASKLLTYNEKKNVRYIAIDNEPKMIAIAKERLKRDKRAKVMLENASTCKYEKCCLFISYYTIQFINPSVRQDLINKIYKALEWGGAVIIYEKVRGPDARFQDMLTQLYNDYKLQQGFKESEIIHKTRSLKGVLEPFSTAGNLGLLRRAGFTDIMILYKYLCFEGYLCIK